MADSRLTDPLRREITLYDRTWFGHIVKGHPEIAEDRLLVEQAVTRPTEIRQSASDPDCRLYYGSGPRPTVIMMVVVDVAIGVVKTAHLAGKITGGPVEWS
ncbi:MAG: hypothetical protein ABII12_02570 [Planctomycetota bacterium]